MDGVRVGGLLGADGEVQGLERLRRPVVEVAEQGQDRRGEGDLADVRAGRPRVLQAVGGLGGEPGFRFGDGAVEDGVRDLRVEAEKAVPLEPLGLAQASSSSG